MNLAKGWKLDKLLFEMTGTETRYIGKTRLAPTPSGYLHLGNVFSFVITIGLAKKHGASVFLRIDDMDAERIRPAYIQDIFDTLHFLDIPWDQGPKDPEDFALSYAQHYRSDLYQEALHYLRDAGHLFACTCSRSQRQVVVQTGNIDDPCLHKGLPFDQPGVSWRLRTPRGLQQEWLAYGQGSQKGAWSPQMHHFIVRKKNGDPAYQLSSLVDDIYYGVDLVVRGDDLLEATLVQSYLAGLLPGDSFKQKQFFHHPLLRDEEGAKMAKSAGSQSVSYLRKQGVSCPDLYSHLSARLGLKGKAANWLELFNEVSENDVLGQYLGDGLEE